MSDGPSKSQLLIYQSDDGTIKIDVRFENETVWLTQQLMAELSQTTKQNIGQHLKNTFDEAELAETSVVKKFFTTAADGKHYQTNFYNAEKEGRQGMRLAFSHPDDAAVRKFRMVRPESGMWARAATIRNSRRVPAATIIRFAITAPKNKDGKT